MLHQLQGTSRLFALLSKVNHTTRKDTVLDLPLLEHTEEVEVVGLPSIGGRKLYILPVNTDNSGSLELGGQDSLLWINWDIQFL